VIAHPKDVPLVREEVLRDCPNLVFTEPGISRLDDVMTFLQKLDEADHPLAKRAHDQFLDRLRYLNGYGGTVSDSDLRRRYRVALGWDGSPLCFSVTWSSLNLKTGDYVAVLWGGLIWHGGPNDPFVVNLDEGALWGVHT